MSQESLLETDENWACSTERRFGRDEMNLAEFPLGTLSDRTAPGQNTLVFEDHIYDHGRGEPITRRLTISASDKYGLPTSLDDEVILGLIELTNESQFSSRKVEFSRYHLLEILGWRDEGRSYHRLDASLRRWLGVTLYYDRAWWDKATGAWVDEHFHILEQVTIRRRDQGRAAPQKSPPLSSFVWNEVVFRSFQAGYLKRLDWHTFRSLRLPTAKRMYRFLDKRFYHKDSWEFDLGEFAREHIGLSRSYDTGQLKRKLLPGLKELEEARFLEPLSSERRFVRLGRGNWRIVVKRQAEASAERVRQTPPSETVQALLERGVSPQMARRLVAEKGEEFVSRQTAAFDRLLKSAHHAALRNPAGFLVAAIRREFALEGPKTTMPRREAHTSSPPQKRASDEASPDEARFTNYLESLSPEERARLEEKALQKTSGLLRDRFEEARKLGQETLRRLYLEAIVRAFLRQKGAPRPVMGGSHTTVLKNAQAA
jgi:plasmid replication initiation protein